MKTYKQPHKPFSFYSLASIILIAIMLAGISACQPDSSPSSEYPILFPSVEVVDNIRSGDNEFPEESPEPSPDDNGTVAVESISIDIESTQVDKGTVINPQVIILPSDATDLTYALTSGDENILLQTDEGFVAVGGGVAEITATASNGVSAKVSIAVVVPVESISLNAEHISLHRGESITLTPLIYPDDATEQRVRFSSGDETVATVDSNGVIRAVAGGSAVIECSVGEVSASVNVTVSVPVTNITLSLDKRIYAVGDQGRLTIQTSPQDATDTSFTVSINGSAEMTGETTFTCTAGGQATITVTFAGGASARQTIDIVDVSALAREVFDLTNTERANAGLPAFSSMNALTQTAHVRAVEIIQHFSHTRPDGSSCFTAFDENNVQYRTAGENLAAGQRTPAEVVKAWMDSPGHRENIMNSAFGHLGIGVTMDSNGRLYWTQMFTD